MSLSNLRQAGLALQMYRNDNQGFFPVAAYQSRPDRPRFRWADALYPYLQVTEIYFSPNMPEEERPRMNKPFFHTTDQFTNPGLLPTTKYFGGYGYNWQYLGNGRETGGLPPYFTRGKEIRATSRTLAIADTDGSKNGTTLKTTEAVYVIDPPLGSLVLGSKGSRKTAAGPGPGNAYYTGGTDLDPLHRSTPASRNNGKVACLFVDGHSETLTLKQLDDSNADGQPDNGLWNGQDDPTKR
jgi:prepilin-type processing-associated H-X9-DG protein